MEKEKLKILVLKELKKIKDNISKGSISAIDRVKDRVDKRRNEKVYDKNGLLYTTMMVFNNFYRVPPCLLEEEESSYLVTKDRLDDAKELQDILSSITQWNKEHKGK